jgi:uncharacterized protein
MCGRIPVPGRNRILFSAGHHLADSPTHDEERDVNEIEDWRRWRVWREEQLREPHGVLAVTGTYPLGTEPAPILEGEPVLWSASPDKKAVVVTAKAEHGLVLDGEPLDGTAVLRVDSPDHRRTLTAPEYDIVLVPMIRDGATVLRVFDPKAPALTSFEGVDGFDFAPAWALDAKFTPYQDRRVEQLPNTDGVTRGLGLDGIVEFALEDGAHSLQATLIASGGLSIVFADPTTAGSKPPFRVLDTPAAAEDGSVVLDFNRAYLPPCAFVDHYFCPAPPRGNILDSPVRAGELAVRTR